MTFAFVLFLHIYITATFGGSRHNIHCNGTTHIPTLINNMPYHGIMQSEFADTVTHYPAEGRAAQHNHLPTALQC